METLLSFNPEFWALQTVAMMLTALLIPGLTVSGPIGAFLAVAALAFINTKVWDTALFMSVPDSLTLKAGMLLLVNGAIFWVMVKAMPGIAVRGILPALAAPVVFTVLTLTLPDVAKRIDWQALLQRGSGIVQEILPSTEVGKPLSSPHP